MYITAALFILALAVEMVYSPRIAVTRLKKVLLWYGRYPNRRFVIIF
jgi:hypothetical protein